MKQYRQPLLFGRFFVDAGVHPAAGEIYFINNYTILHARTAFDDGDTEEDRRRHLLRLWLDVPQMRPVHPHIKSGGIEAVAGRRPSYDWSKLTNSRN